MTKVMRDRGQGRRNRGRWTRNPPTCSGAVCTRDRPAECLPVQGLPAQPALRHRARSSATRCCARRSTRIVQPALRARAEGAPMPEWPSTTGRLGRLLRRAGGPIPRRLISSAAIEHGRKDILMGTIGWIILGVIVLVVVYLVFLYNRLVSLRQTGQPVLVGHLGPAQAAPRPGAQSGRDGEGLCRHERGTLEAVTAARNAAVAASGPEAAAKAENMLTGALRQLFALVRGLSRPQGQPEFPPAPVGTLRHREQDRRLAALLQQLGPGIQHLDRAVPGGPHRPPVRLHRPRILRARRGRGGRRRRPAVGQVLSGAPCTPSSNSVDLGFGKPAPIPPGTGRGDHPKDGGWGPSPSDRRRLATVATHEPRPMGTYGLKSHIWNNRLKSVLLLAGFPVPAAADLLRLRAGHRGLRQSRYRPGLRERLRPAAGAGPDRRRRCRWSGGSSPSSPIRASSTPPPAPMSSTGAAIRGSGTCSKTSASAAASPCRRCGSSIPTPATPSPAASARSTIRSPSPAVWSTRSTMPSSRRCSPMS